jgi:hypothetical protein
VIRIVISSNEMKQTVDVETTSSFADTIESIRVAMNNHTNLLVDTEDRMIFISANIIATSVIEVMKETEPKSPYDEEE